MLPKLAHLPEGPFVGLGVGYAVLSIWFVLMGAYRQWVNDHALAERRYLGLKRGMVAALTAYMTLLVAATAWVLFWDPDSRGVILPLSAGQQPSSSPAGLPQYIAARPVNGREEESRWTCRNSVSLTWRNK